MFKRIVPVFILGLLVLSLALAACGDNSTALPAAAVTTAAANTNTTAAAAAFPAYSGAVGVTVPDSIKGDPGDLAKKLKNTNFTAFKTGDDSIKIKTNFQSSFTGSGWSDITEKEFPAAANQQLTQLGITPLAFQKGGQTATLTLYTAGDITKTMGFTDVNSGTIYIVITGDNS